MKNAMISLRELLAKQNVGYLRELLRWTETPGGSRMKKAELVEQTAQALLDPERLQKALLFLTPEVVRLLDESLTEYTKSGRILIQTLENTRQTAEQRIRKVMEYSGIVSVKSEKDGQTGLTVPRELVEAYGRVPEEMRMMLMQAKWIYWLVRSFMSGCLALYGAFRLEDAFGWLNALIGKDPLLKQMEKIDADMQRVLTAQFNTDDYLLESAETDGEWMVRLNFLDDRGWIDRELVEQLENERKNKPRYAPDMKELITLSEDDTAVADAESLKEGRKLLAGLCAGPADIGLIEMTIADVIDLLQVNSGESDAIGLLTDGQLPLRQLSDDDLERLAQWVTKLNDHMRMWSNFGHTPEEAVRLMAPKAGRSPMGGKMEIHMGPGALEALADGRIDLEQLRRSLPGVVIEADGAKKKKVGRDDPCPCGSGRKYKNCCGKRLN